MSSGWTISKRTSTLSKTPASISSATPSRSLHPRKRLSPSAGQWDFDFASAFPGRLALGDPDHVPAGQYARQALEALGWWPALKSRIAPAPDVRAALVYVERGECAAGLVYATDAAQSDRVITLATVPDSLHRPIVYPAAIVKGRASAQTRNLLAFFSSDTAASIFRKHGFTFLGDQRVQR